MNTDESKSKIIEICMCMDIDFLEPSIIAIKSILHNSVIGFEFIRFNIVAPPNTKHIFKTQIQKKINKIQYRIMEFNPPFSLQQLLLKMKNHKIVKELKCYSTAINYLNYSRYYLHQLFPDLNKIIYIDGDVIVQGDISNLYQTYFPNPNHIFLGAVDGYVNQLKYFNHNHSIKLPQIQKTKIFNAGVYITLLNQWRQKNIDKVLEEWIYKNISEPDKLLYFCGTEPPLNLVFSEDKRLKIDTKWNFIHKWESKYNKKQNLKYQDAYMIHFKGSKKPWRKECKPKWNKLWKKYANL